MKKILVAILILFSTRASAEVVLGGSSIGLSNIPSQFLAAPATSTISELREAQEAAGDLSFQKAVLTIGEPGSEPLTINLTARRLTLIDSLIVTNGHTVIIYADEISVDQKSKIVAARSDLPPPSTLPPGILDGRHGKSGINGGMLKLNLTKGITGRLFIDVSGQDGQDGGNGRQGTEGVEGKNGKDAKARITCTSGPGRGENGGDGTNGGRGGNGGNGGNGGTLEIVFHNIPVAVQQVGYDITQGDAGHHGIGGRGGKGGAGGKRGKNTSPCDWTGADAGNGSKGRNGVAGKNGKDGNNGQPGHFIASRIDLPV